MDHCILVDNFILRISKDEWERRVFALKSYYAGVRRNWEAGSNILFIKKAEAGDAFIGYGVIGSVAGLEEMNAEEKQFCLDNNWNKKLAFAKMVRFEPPVPVKETIVSKWGQKGALLHGAPISVLDLDSIIKIARVKIVS